MGLLSLTLDSGIKVSAIVFRQSETYGSLLEGKRSGRNNTRLLERAIEKAEMLWPNVPVHTILPTVFSDEQGNEQLPAVQCMTYWESLSVKSHENTGSLLVTIHYQNQIEPHIIPEIVNKITSLNWNELATDYQL